MTRMNSRGDEIQDFVKTNVQPTTDKKGKQLTFTDQYPGKPRQTQGIKGPRRTKHTSTRKLWKQHWPYQAFGVGKLCRIHTRTILSTKAQVKKKKRQLSSSNTVIRRMRNNRLWLNQTLTNTSPLFLILKP